MGRFINKGNGGFTKSLKKEYVDKTGLIAFMNDQLDSDSRFVCCTRARRFGKTMAARMLCAYYDKSCDSRSLFEGLEIASDKPVNPEDKDGPKMRDTFEKHLNKYPTIYIDMTGFVSRRDVYGDNLVGAVEKELSEDLRAAYPDIAFSGNELLANVLLKIYNSTKEMFILIMDEWDAILRESSIKDKVAKDWIGFLRSLFKDENNNLVFAGVYLTGILPIIKHNTQSALNNFREYNIITPGPIAKYLGFTKEEVQDLCRKHNMGFEEMETWYDGYQSRDLCSIFNPNSVMMAIDYRKCIQYWGRTGAADELVPYLRLELKKDVQTLLEGGSIPVKTDSFNNRLDDTNTRDKVFTALIHLGYLSYDGKRARIPNQELMLYFASNIEDADLGDLSKVLSLSRRCLDSIEYNDCEEVSDLIAYVHNDVCGAQEYNKEQLLYTTLREALYYAHSQYIFHREYPSGKGFADLVLIPRPGNRIPGIVVELKWDKDAQGPIAQIKGRNYTQKVFEYTKDVILVGINYDPKTKEHQCTIENVSAPGKDSI